MKRKSSTLALTLLLVYLLPITLNVALVQADKTGIGKFLTIDILGEGYVVATKVESGETWIFDQNGTQKVGAGTILLEAINHTNWKFSHWEGDLAGSTNPIEYKTEKYGYIIAVFTPQTFTVIASAVGSGTINPNGSISVNYGADQAFEFIPDPGNHISAIIIDGVYSSDFIQSYTFFHVTANHTIEVYFSADGTASVPAGNNVNVFLASGAGVSFNETGGGTITGGQEYYLAGGATAWEINVTFTFTGEALITLLYNDTGLSLADELNLRLVRADSIEILRSDVNNDLSIDGTDVSIVANAVKQNLWYDPLLDINNDGFVDEADIQIVNSSKGAFLEDIRDGINTDLNLIWGTTSQFSIYGVT